MWLFCCLMILLPHCSSFYDGSGMKQNRRHLPIKEEIPILTLPGGFLLILKGSNFGKCPYNGSLSSNCPIGSEKKNVIILFSVHKFNFELSRVEKFGKFGKIPNFGHTMSQMFWTQKGRITSIFVQLHKMANYIIFSS